MLCQGLKLDIFCALERSGKGMVINMVYKNAEIYNVAELDVQQDGGITWYRMPKSLMDSFELNKGKQNVSSTGVEIRFIIKSGSATIRMQSLSKSSTHACFHIYRGGIQGGYSDHEINTYVPIEPCDFVIDKSKNIDTLRLIAREAGDSFDPAVVRIIFDRGAYKILDISGDIEPPSKEQVPSKTLLCYGSSITHGSNSIDTSHSWPSLLAHNLNMDLRNLGMAGSCAMEPDVIDYIASEGEQGNWDMAIMELGINVLRWEKDKIKSRVTNAVRQVAERNPNKKVIIISPFYCGDDYHGKTEPNIWRTVTEEIIKNLGFENVTYINGLELLDNMTLISADEVHPNIYGVQQIAERLIAKLI